MDTASITALIVAVGAGALLALELVARSILTIRRLRAPHLPGVRGLVVAATVLAALGRAPAQAATPPPAFWLERPSAPDRPQPATAVVELDARYRVQPGDSLWGIAARMLRDEEGVQPASADVDRLWRSIYEANRAVVGSDPDLIFPGQRLSIPLEA